MNTNTLFNPARIVQLVRVDLVTSWKKALITLGAFFVLFFLFSLLYAADGPISPNDQFHLNSFGLFILIGGFLFTSILFNEMNNEHERQFYLMLPASNLEKFIAKWLESVLLFPIIFIVAYILCFFIIDPLIFGLTNNDLPTFQLGNEWILFFIKLYICISGVFFLGAVFFHKYAIIKTLSSVAFIGFSMVGIALLLVRIVFFDFFDGWEGIGSDEIEPAPWVINFFDHQIEYVAKTALFIVLPLLTWTIAYFKLKEKEV